MIIVISIIGAILGIIFWNQMLRATRVTAASTAAQAQIMLDAMAPEQRERVAIAQEERRKRLAAEKAAAGKRRLLFAIVAIIVLFIYAIATNPPQKIEPGAPEAATAPTTQRTAPVAAPIETPRRFSISPQ